MAQTKKLLDGQSLDNVLSEVNITKDKFTNDKGDDIYYNRLELVFDNGDKVYIKPGDELKTAVYYATTYPQQKA